MAKHLPLDFIDFQIDSRIFPKRDELLLERTQGRISMILSHQAYQSVLEVPLELSPLYRSMFSTLCRDVD